MDLEVARKALAKRSAFSSKRVAFFIVAGLCLVAGILLRFGEYFDTREIEETVPVAVSPPPAAPAPAVEATESVAKTPPPAQEFATAPNEAAEQTGEAIEQAKPADDTVEQAVQPEAPGAGMILVSKKPIAMLANPSSSAPTMYGFPAGRPFRVIGHDGGFVQIKDLKSGASGWIDEAALAPPPRMPAVSAPSQPRPAAVSPRPAKPSVDLKPKKDRPPTASSESADAEPDAVQTRRPSGLLGGLLGGIFGNGN
jgi:hypothetical protein